MENKIDRTIGLYRSGKTLREIAKVEGVTFQAIHDRLVCGRAFRFEPHVATLPQT